MATALRGHAGNLRLYPSQSNIEVPRMPTQSRGHGTVVCPHIVGLGDAGFSATATATAGFGSFGSFR
jgi:hypothetical protein